MGRRLVISAVLTAYLAVPVLCIGGVVLHVCECATEADCACDAHDHHESGCNHESGCSDDPCSRQVIRPERPNSDLVPMPQSAVGCVVALDAEIRAVARMVRFHSADSGPAKHLVRPPGALPLLI